MSEKTPEQRKVHGKRYTVAQKLAVKALQDSGMSAKEAAPIAGAHPRTIMRIWEDKELDELAPTVVSSIKSGLGGLFYKRALGASLAITPEKLSESTALQLATVAGIMTEKGRLMEGLSTDNISFRGTAQAIDADRQALMKRIQDLKDAP